MLEQAQKYYQRYSPYLRELQDVRVLGMVVFAIVVLLVSWSSIKAIETNYKLQRQISAIEQQNDLKRLENSNTRLQNEYYKTDQYLELSARQNFGLAKPGETELIVPKEIAYSHSVPTAKAAPSQAAGAQPFWQKNLQAWVNFFLHRQSDR